MIAATVARALTLPMRPLYVRSRRLQQDTCGYPRLDKVLSCKMRAQKQADAIATERMTGRRDTPMIETPCDWGRRPRSDDPFARTAEWGWRTDSVV